MAAPFPDQPSHRVPSPDGGSIAVFTMGAGPPLLLVHGTTADHRTWRVVAPVLAGRWTVHAIDRRGRGASADGPGPYAAARELEDLAAVASTIADEAGVAAIPVVGHSLGGRLALAAAARMPAIGRVVAYESAPPAHPQVPGGRDALLDALRGDLARGDHDALLERFMREAVGMPEADLAAFRANPVWPLRAAAAPTIVREMEAASDPAIGLDALARVGVPVLQLVGTASPPGYLEAAAALDARLVAGRLEHIEGARHAAHHTHPAAFIEAVAAFLGR